MRATTSAFPQKNDCCLNSTIIFSLCSKEQYHVVQMPIGLVGLDWEYGDRQAGPCMGRCMGGAWWCGV